jgi:hypothetical protein
VRVRRLAINRKFSHFDRLATAEIRSLEYA